MTARSDAGTSGWEGARDAGIRNLEAGEFGEAATALEDATGGDPTGESDMLLALALFHQERYESAIERLQAALEHDPENQAWKELLQAATANMTAEVHVPVPDIYNFDRDQLLAKPVVPPGALPPPPAPAPPLGMLDRRRRGLGNVLGAIASVVLDIVTNLLGRLLGYRDRVWTNWYRRRFTIGLLILAYMRERLNADNLKSTYPSDALTAFQPEGQPIPEGVTHFRTADGSWNNLSDPKEGAAGTRFPRNVENDTIQPETGETLMTPNPREIIQRQGFFHLLTETLLKALCIPLV